jgi:hypothetical protein
MASGSSRLANASAAFIASTLPTISLALRFSVLPSSASAMALAPEVTFSIMDEAADSERSNTDA